MIPEMRFHISTVTIFLVFASLVSGQFPFENGFQAPTFQHGIAGDQMSLANNFQDPAKRPNFNSNDGVRGGNFERNNQRPHSNANANYGTNVPSSNFPSPFKPLNSTDARQQLRRNGFNDPQNSQSYPINRPIQRFPVAPSNQEPIRNAPVFSNQASRLNRNSDLHPFNTLPQSNNAKALQGFPINRYPVQPFPNQETMQSGPSFSNPPSQLNRNFDPRVFRPIPQYNDAQNSRGFRINRPFLSPISSPQRPMGNVPMFSNQRPQLNSNFNRRILNPSSEPNSHPGKSNGFESSQPNVFQQLPPNLSSLLTGILQNPSNFNTGASNLQKYPDSLQRYKPINANPNQNRNQPEFNAPNPILAANLEKPKIKDNRQQTEFNRANPILKPQNQDNTRLQYVQMPPTSSPDSGHTQSSEVFKKASPEETEAVTLPASFWLDLLSSLDDGIMHNSPTNEDVSTKPANLETTTSTASYTVPITTSTEQLDSQNDDITPTTPSSDIHLILGNTSEEPYSTTVATFTKFTNIVSTAPSSDINVPENITEEPYSTTVGNNAVTEEDNKLTESITETDTTLSQTTFGDIIESEESACGEDEDWWDCMPLYHNTCDNFARAGTRKDFDCKPGCFCMEGLIKTSDGQCVDPDYCPDPICEDNEEETDCLNQCNTCEANCGPCTLQICIPGCDCMDGYKRSDNGTCIHASECPVCTTSAAATQNPLSK